MNTTPFPLLPPNPHIIDLDEIKTHLPGYDPSDASTFHRQSSQKADALYDQALLSPRYSHVILLAGGSASGKTEFCSTQLSRTPVIIFDSTLSSSTAFANKYDRAKKHHKTLQIIYIMPASLEDCYLAFLNRERKVPTASFVSTHIESRVVMCQVLSKAKYDSVAIDIYLSRVVQMSMQFYPILSRASRLKKLAFFESEQLTRQEVLSIVESNPS